MFVYLDQDLDLRHTDPRMTRVDHDLRGIPGPQPSQMPVAGMGIGMPTTMQQQSIVRPTQPISEMDA